jgi:hypothetical protein
MAGVFQDIEAAGQESRRERVFVAVGATGALILASMFVFRDIGYFLLSVYAVALPIFFVVESSLGLIRRDPSLGFLAYLAARALEFVVIVVVFLASFLLRRDGIDWEVIGFLGAPLAALLARIVYRWRELRRPTNHEFGDDPSAFVVLSRSARHIHWASYAIGFAAALVAVSQFDTWQSVGSAFVAGFLAGKLAVDLLWQTPASLAAGPPSRALTKMTALSPFLWGLPWGVLAGAYYAHWMLSLRPQDTAWALIDGAGVGLRVAIAVSLVLGLVTAVAYLHEWLAGAWGEPDDDDAAEIRYWALGYWCVFGLALAGAALMVDPMEPRDEEVFGEETWTCAKRGDDYELAWVGRAGVRISFRRHYIDLFNISCVPDAGGRTCDYDDEGWHEITIAVTRNGSALAPITFKRDTPGVKSDYRHHADIVGDLADKIVDAFRSGQSARMIIRSKNGRLLYEKTIDLRGFVEGQNACQTRWG